MDPVPCIEEGLTSRLSHPLPSPLALPLYLSTWIAGLSPAHGCSVLPECAWRDQPSVARQRIRAEQHLGSAVCIRTGLGEDATRP